MRNEQPYAKDWDRIAEEIKKDAKWTCATCGKQHGDADEQGRTIQLGVAHLDQNRMNNDSENLRALCQHCHFQYDASFNVMKRKYGKNFHLPPQLSIDF